MSTSSPDSAAERASPRWRPFWTGALLLAATAAALAMATPRLLAHVGDGGFVAPGDPRARVDREITAAFGFQNPVVWTIAAKRDTIWTPPMLARVTAFTREVFTIPGVVATDVVSLASPNLRDLRVTDDGLEPVYLMGAVPETPEAVQALRARVENDPKYAATVVSRDGRAAMIVADFRTNADPIAIGTAAIALRDRYRDGDADVHASGAPVVAVLARRAARGLALPLAVIAASGLLSLVIVAGRRRALGAILAAGTAVAWLVVLLAMVGTFRLPWAAFALAPTAFVAAALSLDDRISARRLVVSCAALALGFASLAGASPPPAAGFGLAVCAGAPLAVAADGIVRWFARPHDLPPRNDDGRWLARLLFAGSLVGLAMLDVSFGLTGYGIRYLPGEAGLDLRAVARQFPPPTTIAFRLRGPAGFVQEPATLAALDAAATAARSDPATRSAMSLADIVKLVHRAFNDDDPSFERLPGDRALAARYLALAYSPAFRRFVDRAFADTAVWAYLESERRADVARVTDRMQAALVTHPLPDVVVEGPGGDGAVLLAMADIASQLAMGGLALVVVMALVIGVGCGWHAGARAAAGALVTGTAALGLFGWLGLPIDLVTLAATIAAVGASAAVAGFGAAAGGPAERLVIPLLCAGAVAVAIPLAATRVVGILLLAPAAGLGTTSNRLPGSGKTSRSDATSPLARQVQRGAA
ncbi:MAG TPA: hypothetical protein VMS22_05365 [Candidatus Eisenbacteria bacterium]|nr:hypothetical protein [Candidatus Eisenbacteria bacterium]